MNRQRLRLIFRVLGFIFLPLFFLTCLITYSVISPWFLTSFDVVNSTATDLYVTPIGAVGKEGRRRTLPLSSSERLRLMSTRRSNFLIPAGSTLRFTYDWDDIQFSEILCRTTASPYRFITTGLHPTEQQYRIPSQTRFEIAEFSSLEPASDLHLAALKLREGRVLFVYFLAGIGLLSPVFFWLSKRISTTPHGMSFFQKLFGSTQYDEAACIRILLDRTQPLAERGAAAESLYTGQSPTATAALVRFILDETEEAVLREEAATTLGGIYDVVGIDHETLTTIPPHYREEVLANISKNGA